MSLRVNFLLYFVNSYTCYDVNLMFVLSSLLVWLYVGYKHGFSTKFSYGSHHVLISK